MSSISEIIGTHKPDLGAYEELCEYEYVARVVSASMMELLVTRITTFILCRVPTYLQICDTEFDVHISIFQTTY